MLDIKNYKVARVIDIVMAVLLLIATASPLVIVSVFSVKEGIFDMGSYSFDDSYGWAMMFGIVFYIIAIAVLTWGLFGLVFMILSAVFENKAKKASHVLQYIKFTRLSLIFHFPLAGFYIIIPTEIWMFLKDAIFEKEYNMGNVVGILGIVTLVMFGLAAALLVLSIMAMKDLNRQAAYVKAHIPTQNVYQQQTYQQMPFTNE